MQIIVGLLAFLYITVSLCVIAACCIALWHRDWPQAATWALIDIAITLSSVAARIKT